MAVAFRASLLVLCAYCTSPGRSVTPDWEDGVSFEGNIQRRCGVWGKLLRRKSLLSRLRGGDASGPTVHEAHILRAFSDSYAEDEHYNSVLNSFKLYQSHMEEGMVRTN